METRNIIQEDLFKWREEPISSDVESIRGIVSSTDFFSLEERSIAEELAEERLTKGVSSGYHFLFAEGEGTVIGYACFGPIPGTRESYDLYWIAVRNDQVRVPGLIPFPLGNKPGHPLGHRRDAFHAGVAMLRILRITLPHRCVPRIALAIPVAEPTFPQ